MGTEKTAIHRSSISVPVRFLRDEGLITGRTIDYGCGRGRDADELGCDRYDPYYAPMKPRGKYDTILCTYVLNVLSRKERVQVIEVLRRMLRKGGVAYITVRRDLKKKTRTQYIVRLGLEKIKENSAFCIYALRME